MHMEMNHPYPK